MGSDSLFFRMALAALFLIPAGGSAVQEDPLLAKIRTDLAAGRDVVITSYVGLWYENNDDPGKNLYWGMAYGHDTFFDRAPALAERLPFLGLSAWQTISEITQAEDPCVRKVMAAPAPGGNGARLVVVYLVYRDMERATLAMGLHLKRGEPETGLADDPLVGSLLKRSYVVGYWGHNVYYGGSEVDRLEEIASPTGEPRGVFVIGCRTADWWPGKFLGGTVEPLVFTTTNMAPEAYVAAALYDGLARGLSRSDICRQIARAYQVYQRLERTPGGLFVCEIPD